MTAKASLTNVVDCLLRLKRLKLLPPSVVDQDGGTSAVSSSTERLGHLAKSESGVIFPSSHRGAGTSKHMSGVIGRFSQFLSLDAGGESLLSVGSEFENNIKIIQQCRIGSIFTESVKLPDESVQNLGRALIFAATGKGQKFSTPVEEEETLHDCFRRRVPVAALLPVPFAEKAIVALFRIAVRLLSGAGGGDRMSEELVFKSGYSDPGNAWSSSSSSFSSSSMVAAAATMMMMEDASRMGNLATSMFIKLAEALRKTSLVQREEVRNQRRYGTRRWRSWAEPFVPTPPCALAAGGRSPGPRRTFPGRRRASHAPSRLCLATHALPLPGWRKKTMKRERVGPTCH
ncbi:hypothetical protein OsJ_18123 [Oryza sativa Japonica Group]|uniref:Uncharacterized protein n=1 Tax=Oryza sativa subsp. japonica TaxID=39947 RepID=B9FNY7_ORYSJ|nr:hypothetical protein OsJ_18123 [Oryza sativa Japonica Group]